MKCKCCEKEIDENNSINGVCLECNNEIIKRVKINEIVEELNNKKVAPTIEKTQNDNFSNKNSSRSTIFLCISFIIFNPLGLFSILAIIFGSLGIADADSANSKNGRVAAVISVIGGILITLYQWFIAPSIALNILL